MAVLSSLLSGIFALFCAMIAWLAGGSLVGVALVYGIAAFGLFALLMLPWLLTDNRGGKESERGISAELLALGEEMQARLPCAGKTPV